MLEKKIYYFDFGNTFKKVLSYFLMEVCIIGFFVILDFVTVFLFNIYIEEMIKNEKLSDIVKKVLICIILIFEAYGLIIQFFPKKIILTDKGIKIKRNTFDGKTLVPFNDYIKYKNIKLCRINHSEYKYRWVKWMPITFPVCNLESLVLIKTRFREYFVPIKDADDFIEEVNKRMTLIKASDTENTENDSCVVK